MSLDIRLLKPFLAVSETLSFTRAAERMGVAQSRISLLVKRLEAQVGFPVFLRGPRHIELTPEGAKLREHALLVEASIRQLDDVVRGAQTSRRRCLLIGSPRVFELVRRMRLIEQFHEDRPSVRLQFKHDRTPKLIDALRAGEFEVTFASYPFDAAGLETFCFATSDVRMVIPREHPLANRSILEPADLRGQTVAVYPSIIGKQYFDPWFGGLEKVGAVVTEAPDDHAIALARFAASRRILGLVHVWRDQLLPPDVLESMTLLPITQSESIRLPLMLARRPGVLSPAAEAFWRLAQVLAEDPISETSNV